MDLNVTRTVSMALRHDDDEGVSAILIAKIVSMVALSSVSIIMGLLPMILGKCLGWNPENMTPRSAKIIKLVLGFSGGVLLATTFLHMLPEVIESVEALVTAGTLPDIGLSLGELFMCLGFFVMYFVEELVHAYLRRNIKRHERELANSQDEKNVTKSTNELVENGQSSSHGAKNPLGLGHGHSHLPVLPQGEDPIVNAVRGLLIVLGLSIHELFEGLAIGLQSTSSGVWTLFLGVAAHKFIIAFCIGVELFTSKTKPYLIVIYICAYGLVSPIGTGVGMALIGTGDTVSSGPAAVILQGMATGTLLFVVFFEILRKEHGLTNWLAIFVGFVIMACVEMATGHNHSHSHSSTDDDHSHSH